MDSRGKSRKDEEEGREREKKSQPSFIIDISFRSSWRKDRHGRTRTLVGEGGQKKSWRNMWGRN